MWHIVSYPLQLWPGLHWRDQTETGDKGEGTLGCLQEGDDRQLSCSKAYMGELPPCPLLHGEETEILDHHRGHGLLVKEILHVGMTPLEDHFYRGWRTESP